ncbi:MAG: lipid II flippase MurJ [Victivallales bacterium]
MAELKRISHVSIFLLFIYIAKSILAVALRTSMTAWFGAGMETDAYFAAFTIPQTLSDFFIGGILFIVIIPVFQRRTAEVGEIEASKDISPLLNFSLLVLAGMTLLYCLLVPFLTPLVFPGFKGHKLELTIRFAMIFSPAIILMGISLIFTSLYHSFREFFVPSIAALLFPISSLLSIWFLPSSWGIERLIYGNIAGSALGLVAMMILINRRIKWRWNWNLSNPVIKSAFLLSWPVLLESIFSRMVPVIHKSIASGLPEKNAVTLIELSLFVIGSIIGFISGPISTAVYPLMGQQNIENDEKTVFQTFFKSLNVIFFLTVPFNILLLTESREIVTLLFGYGKFTQNDCLVTANIIIILSFIILPSCFLSIAGRLFFIFHETKAISFWIIGLVMVFLPLYYAGAYAWGLYGLMIAAVAGTLSGNLGIFIILKIKHKHISFREPVTYLFKIITCGIIMGVLIVILNLFLNNLTMPLLVRFSVATLAGVFTYYMACKILKIDEVDYIIKRIPGLN